MLSLGLFLFGRFMIQKPKYTSLDHWANRLGKTVCFVWRDCAAVRGLFSSGLNEQELPSESTNAEQYPVLRVQSCIQGFLIGSQSWYH